MTSRAPEHAVAGQTDVVIVGGGPVGCALAIDLRLRGIRCTVIEREESISYDMRAMNNDMRTMEWLRRWGVADAVRACNTVPPEFQHDLVFCTALSGKELGVFRAYGFRPEDARELAAERGQPVSQKYTGRMLRRRAQELGAEILTGWECVDVAQTEDGASARIVAVDGGAERELSGTYLVGCDGGRSRVRAAVGIGRSGAGGLGKHVHVVVGAPRLLTDVTVSPGCFYILFNPEVGGLVLPSEVDEFNFHLAGFDADEDTSGVDLERLAKIAIGRDVDVEIRMVSPYLIHELIADEYRAGRVFIAGDAAHLFCPFGGFNMNTGIGDAGNLGWKLAARLRGWAGDALLDSYGAERRQIAQINCAEATRNVKALVAAVGEVMAHGVPDGDGADDDAARRRLGQELYDRTFSEWNTSGVVLDQRYTSSPVVVDDGSDAPEWDVTAYAPVAKPGHRAPHAWLGDDLALYDRLGPGLTLLDLRADATDTAAFAAAAHERSMPLAVVAVDDPHVRELYEAPLVLVRPDQHVAWRGDHPDPDAGTILDVARGAVPATVRQPA